MNIDKDITIIIPIYNEAENIGLLIDVIFQKYSDLKIMVIDDFSNDESKNIVKQKIVKHNSKSITLYDKTLLIHSKGLTASILEWISNVTSTYFVVMDWDFQHPVENINDFRNLFKEGKEIVIWERDKIVFEEKQYRIFISKIGNHLVNLKLGKNKYIFHDPLSWFFWWKTQIFQKEIYKHKWSFIWSGYKFLFEFLKIIDISKHQIWFFYFNFWKRKYGNSKISFRTHIDFLKWLFKK